MDQQWDDCSTLTSYELAEYFDETNATVNSDISTLNSDLKNDVKLFNLDFVETDLSQDSEGSYCLQGKGFLTTTIDPESARTRNLVLDVNLLRDGRKLKLPVAKLSLTLPDDARKNMTKNTLSGLALGLWSSTLVYESLHRKSPPQLRSKKQ